MALGSGAWKIFGASKRIVKGVVPGVGWSYGSFAGQRREPGEDACRQRGCNGAGTRSLSAFFGDASEGMGATMGVNECLSRLLAPCIPQRSIHLLSADEGMPLGGAFFGDVFAGMCSHARASCR